MGEKKVYLLAELEEEGCGLFKKKKCYHGMNCAWDLLETLEFFLTLSVFAKAGKRCRHILPCC